MSSEPRDDLEVEQNGSVTVVRFRVSCLNEANLQVVGEELLSLAAKRSHPKMVLDFESVQLMSSAALGLLICLHMKLRAVGGRVSIRNLNGELLGIFKKTRLDRLFGTEDDSDGDLGGVPARHKPPKPSGGGAVSLPPPIEEDG